MSKTYFQRVTEQTPTMFWINNPTSEQADWALENGALGCTNNPSYSQKMLAHPDYSKYAFDLLDDVLRDVADDRKAAIEFQARMVKPVADKFMPLFEKSGGEHGFVQLCLGQLAAPENRLLPLEPFRE